MMGKKNIGYKMETRICKLLQVQVQVFIGWFMEMDEFKRFENIK